MQQEVVIIGAGKIGRGYMGQIFFEAGYRIIFVDILPDLIAVLDQQKKYKIFEVDTGIQNKHTIRITRAVHAENQVVLSEFLSHVPLVVCSVGAANLPDVAVNIAAAIRYRLKQDIVSPLNILIAENLMNGTQKFTKMVHRLLKDEEVAFMKDTVGIVGTVIGRTVPPPPPSFGNQSIANVIVEPHREFYANQFDFVGPSPKIDGVHLTAKYDAVVSRKLYVHNCTHAVMGYVGHYYGHRYSHEAMADERVANIVWQAMEETANAVGIEFGFSEVEMHDYISDLFHRYQNVELWDTLVRIGRDPIRKLRPDDRLIGAARLIERTGGIPKALVIGIAAALCFSDVEDPKAEKLQDLVRNSGIENALEEISSIKGNEPLGQAIVEAYHHLRQC